MSSNRGSFTKLTPSNTEDHRNEESFTEKPPAISKTPTNKRLDLEIKEKESMLAGLKAEIRSRQKIVAQFAQASDPTFQEKLQILEEEVALRDRQIQVLNDRLIVLDAQLRENSIENAAKQRDYLLDKIKEDLTKSLKEQSFLEDKIKNAENELKTERARTEAEREKAEKAKEVADKSQSKLQSEYDKLKNDLGKSREEVTKALGLNKDLSEKVVEMRKQVAELSQKVEEGKQIVFELNLSSKKSGELQKSILEMGETLKSRDNELKTKHDECELLRSEKARLELVCFEQSQRVDNIKNLLVAEANKTKELENQLRIKENSLLGQVESITNQLNQAVNQLQLVKVELDSKKTLEAEIKAKIEQSNQFQLQVRALESSLRDMERNMNLANSQENTLKARISELEKIINQLKAEKNALELSFKEKSLGFDEEIRKLNRSLNESSSNLQEKTTEVDKLMNQNSGLTLKLEELRKSNEDLLAQHNIHERKNKEFKYKLNLLEKEAAEAEKYNATRDNQLKEALNKMKSLESELFARDSLIFQKDGTILKQSKDIEEGKRALQQAIVKFRTNLAEELRNFENQLEEKEREIKILKDMIRSGQTQLKQKESEVSRFKNLMQPQSSRVALDKKPDKVEHFVYAEKILTFLKAIDDLKSYKELKIKENTEKLQPENFNNETVDQLELINTQITSRFTELLKQLQKVLKPNLSKTLDKKILNNKLKIEKDEISIKELLEICAGLCP